MVELGFGISISRAIALVFSDSLDKHCIIVKITYYSGTMPCSSYRHIELRPDCVDILKLAGNILLNFFRGINENSIKP